MLNPVSGASQTQPVAHSTTRTTNATQSKPESTNKTDTVQLSSIAQVALKEATETPAQTAKEANGGDRQAQRLLAKQAAEKLTNRA
jgi:hypothetical protein